MIIIILFDHILFVFAICFTSIPEFLRLKNDCFLSPLRRPIIASMVYNKSTKH